MKAFLLFLLKIYKKGISPFLGTNCRFFPSCSDYACEALKRHPLVKSCFLIVWRLLRCSPWHPGGLDLVPGSRIEDFIETPTANTNPQESLKILPE